MAHIAVPAAAVDAEVIDDPAALRVLLESEGDVLVFDGDGGVRVAASLAAEAGGSLEDTGEVSDAGKLAGRGAAPRVGQFKGVEGVEQGGDAA